MTTIPANLSRFNWASPEGKRRGHFIPNGNVFVGRSFVSPNWRASEPMLAARIFVGFSVGQDPVYSMDDVIPLVKLVRVKQGIPPDASFLYQRGMYTHADGSGTVTEDGAQIVILNLSGASQEEFTNQMIELANILREKLQQETVIIEIQSGGVVKEVIGVTETETEEALG